MNVLIGQVYMIEKWARQNVMKRVMLERNLAMVFFFLISLIVKILLQNKNKKHLCLDINKLWYNYI